MLKNISNLGATLKTSEQKSIIGGGNSICFDSIGRCENRCCPVGYCCGSDPFNCVLAGPGGRNCR